MIPADVTSRLQLAADVALRPVAPSEELSDKLSGMISGQRVLADIQALLPNGTYRAIINQRDITLALPFAAKSGDSLELEVVESEGKLTLAVIAKPPGDTSKLPVESVPTTLSRTGQLISSLFNSTGYAGESKSGLTPATLNSNQPIAGAPPATAQDLIPLLKQAITQSGMFYESHQADWVDGRMDKASLLQEPQGKLPAYGGLSPASSSDLSTAVRLSNDSTQSQNIVPDATASKSAAAINQQSQLVAPQALPLVQQQLEALATQTFSWQGQVWPGQEMRWEIEEDAARREQATEGTTANWQTRLRLSLPNLGEVDAQIRLQGNQISLALSTGNNDTRELLRTATNTLRSQFDDAGLSLASVGIITEQNEKADGQTAT